MKILQLVNLLLLATLNSGLVSSVDVNRDVKKVVNPNNEVSYELGDTVLEHGDEFNVEYEEIYTEIVLGNILLLNLEHYEISTTSDEIDLHDDGMSIRLSSNIIGEISADVIIEKVTVDYKSGIPESRETIFEHTLFINATSEYDYLSDVNSKNIKIKNISSGSPYNLVRIESIKIYYKIIYDISETAFIASGPQYVWAFQNNIAINSTMPVYKAFHLSEKFEVNKNYAVTLRYKLGTINIYSSKYTMADNGYVSFELLDSNLVIKNIEIETLVVDDALAMPYGNSTSEYAQFIVTTEEEYLGEYSNDEYADVPLSLECNSNSFTIESVANVDNSVVYIKSIKINYGLKK
ncbi:MAG: hypothetical protein LBM99_00575 [Bacillales bacterium]|jgi:hypothetical protein|nr:hypothetical protein [Bacillales bacterium]